MIRVCVDNNHCSAIVPGSLASTSSKKNFRATFFFFSSSFFSVLKIGNAFDIDKLCVSVVKSSEYLLVAVEHPHQFPLMWLQKGPEESTVSGEELICD